MGELLKISSSRGLSYSVHGPICDLNLATLNRELSGTVMRRLRSSLFHAASLKAKTWVLHPGTHGALSWVHPGDDWKANRDRLEVLQRLGDRLKVEVAIENISAGLAILGRVEDFLRLYREWEEAPGVALDIGHAHIERQTDNYLKTLAARIGHVHAHDNKGDFDRHLSVGAGTVQWKKVVKSLLEIGFDGQIVIESVKGPFSSLAKIQSLLRSFQ